MSDAPLPFDAMRRRGEHGVSKLLLDRHLAGEPLDAAEHDAIDHALAQDAGAQRFVAGLDRRVDDADVRRLSDALARRAVPLRRRARWLGPALGLAAAALVLVVVGLPTPASEGVRAKGGERFEIVVRAARDGSVSTLLPGDAIAPGDALRFRVRASRDAFMAVVGIDSAHVAAIYAPADGPLQAVEAGREHVFDGSIVMDDTLGLERFAALYCHAAMSREALTRALDEAARRGDDLATLSSTSGCDVLTIAVAKRR